MTLLGCFIGAVVGWVVVADDIHPMARLVATVVFGLWMGFFGRFA